MLHRLAEQAANALQYGLPIQPVQGQCDDLWSRPRRMSSGAMCVIVP